MQKFRGSGIAIIGLALCGLMPAWADTPALRGAGATFPYPVYSRWIAQYRAETGIDIAYEALGSGAGIQGIEQGRFDFGASDIPLSGEELQHRGLLQFPVIVGGIVPVINIRGIETGELRLNGDVLADIFQGRIHKWNEAAIAALNPGLHLPNARITVVHRSDDSGSTLLWTRFLSQSNPHWTAGVGSRLDWPVGVAAIGNEGLASSVQRTKMAIGYVEYAYARAHRLTVAALRNHDGAFVRPGVDSFRAAMPPAFMVSDDFGLSLIDQPGAESWPITAASFVLLRVSADAIDRNREVVRFFEWAMRRGAKIAIDLDYVPLPATVLQRIAQTWGPLRIPAAAP